MLNVIRTLLGILGAATLTAGGPRLHAAAEMPALPPPTAADSALVLRGRVFDGTGKPPLEHGVVVIRGGRVVAVGPAGRVKVPGAARIIEVATGTILPGLIDLHQHLRPEYAAWLLPAGITTVRDANNTLETLRKAQAIRPFAPRILYSGPLLDGPETFFGSLLGAYGTPDSVLTTLIRPATDGPIREVVVLRAATPAQARAAVDSLAAHGARVIKLYEQLAWPVYQAAAAQARRRHLPVMTDLGMETTRGLSKAQVDARQAMQAGVSSIEHASGYALAYQRLGGDPTREPFDDRLLDQLARETVRRRVALVPTLSAFYAGAAPDSSQRIGALPGGDRVPPPMEQFFAQQLQGFRRESIHKASLADFHLAQALTQRIQQLGGLIGAGTDAPAGAYNLPGGGLHRELALLVEAGLTPAQALYAATGGAARILRQPTLGTLQPGQVADVLVVEGNPTRDIRATRAIRYVIQQGRVLPLTKLVQQAKTEEGSLPD